VLSAAAAVAGIVGAGRKGRRVHAALREYTCDGDIVRMSPKVAYGSVIAGTCQVDLTGADGGPGPHGPWAAWEEQAQAAVWHNAWHTCHVPGVRGRGGGPRRGQTKHDVRR
jgi:hypothetical protein